MFHFLVDFSLFFRRWQVVYFAAIHRQAFPTRARCHDWCRIRCQHGPIESSRHGNPRQITNLGYRWSRELSIHYAVLLSRGSMCLVGLRHYVARFLSQSTQVARRSQTTLPTQNDHSPHWQQTRLGRTTQSHHCRRTRICRPKRTHVSRNIRQNCLQH